MTRPRFESGPPWWEAGESLLFIIIIFIINICHQWQDENPVHWLLPTKNVDSYFHLKQMSADKHSQRHKC
jgi:hypothetical protein